MSEQSQLLGEQQDESVPLVESNNNTNNNINNNNNAPGNEEEEEEEEETLEDYADMVVTILQPVALTMMLVVWVVRLLQASNIVLTSSEAIYQVYSEDAGDGTATKLFGSILNALLFLAVIIGVTVLFVILYKYRCMKIIYAWLIGSTGMLLAVFGGYLFLLILQAQNLALDSITFSFLIWNFTVVGIMSIFWHAPQKVTQGYLIVISGLMAVWFTRLPEWTTWAILAVVAIYDLFAVLCPRGPLKVLVDTAQERKEPIPALLYNASVVMMNVHDDGIQQEAPQLHHDNDVNINNDNNAIIIDPDTTSQQPSATEIITQEKKGVKLGLGDFVFYSVLMGRAALFDMVTVFTCFIAIITGLFMTLLLLAIFRKALPALPISIALGIVFYFLTSLILWPFVVSLGRDQIFV